MTTSDEEQFQRDVHLYLRAEKIIVGQCLWKRKQHPDYREVLKIIECPEMPELNGELRMTAHLSRLPQKFGFAILLGSHRILSLDVDPGRAHFNVKTLVSITSTHWQSFPEYQAVEDERELSHHEWLLEFARRSNMKLDFAYRTPPHEPPQLMLI